MLRLVSGRWGCWCGGWCLLVRLVRSRLVFWWVIIGLLIGLLVS